jgi:TRAP-type C4-dicarboxylate transport system substrate-binding protein
MPPEAQAALKQTGEQIGAIVRARARAEVDEAVAAMVKRGLIVTKPSAQDIKQWESLAEQLYPRIRGKLVPSELFDEVLAHVKAFRSQRR